MAVGFKKDLIYRRLKEEILSGKYPPGSKFPREVEFAAELGVAFVTLRSALKQLEEDGLITRLRSRGTFVNDPRSARPLSREEKPKILLAMRGDQKTENITVNVFNRQLALGVFSQAAYHGMSADLKVFSPETSWEEEAVYARNNGYSAMILDRHSQKMLESIAFESLGFPVILVNREIEHVPSVVCNYVSAIRMAIQRLRELGHRNILLLDHGNDVALFQERQEAFLDELKRGGSRSPESCLITMRNVEWKDFLSKITTSMRAHPEATAIIVQSFYMQQFSEYLANSGISVPSDLSVIQWGERAGCERTSPTPYSLLTEPRTECGQMAVNLIRRIFDGEECSNYHFKVNAELIMRNGCALPRTLRNSLAESIVS